MRFTVFQKQTLIKYEWRNINYCNCNHNCFAFHYWICMGFQEDLWEKPIWNETERIGESGIYLINKVKMSRKILIIIIVPTALLALFGWLGVYGLQGEEPRRALISIEMLKDGDYIFPHMFGWMYYNKPPLFNWLMVGFFQIMGTINEWAVRMPSTLSIIFLAFLNSKALPIH